MKKLIVGIDPGLTTAVSAIDFNSNFVGAVSRKGFSRDDIIYEIAKLGDPVVITTDKKKVPNLVRQIARTFGSKIIAPNKDIPSQEKIDLIRGYNKYIKNDHEEDALASALFAFNQVREKVKRIDKILEKEKLDSLKEDIISLVFKNELKVSDALNVLMNKKPEQKRIVHQTVVVARSSRILEQKLRHLEMSERALKHTIKKLERENEELKEKIKHIRKTKIRRITPKKLEKLVFQLDNLKKLYKEELAKHLEERKELLQAYENIIILKDLSKAELMKAGKIRGKVLFVEKLRGNVSYLEEHEPRLIISPDSVSLKTTIPVIRNVTGFRGRIKKIGGGFFVCRCDIERLMQEHLKTWFQSWIKNYRGRMND